MAGQHTIICTWLMFIKVLYSAKASNLFFFLNAKLQSLHFHVFFVAVCFMKKTKAEANTAVNILI